MIGLIAGLLRGGDAGLGLRGELSCAGKVDSNVQYTKPDHYAESTTASADDCCHACNAAAPGCHAWKWSAQKGNQCRFLASAPTASQRDDAYTSGTAAPAAPTPPPAPGTCLAESYGAVADGKTLNTAAIAAAIANASCSTVAFDGPGVYLSGTIELRSHLALRVGGGATLRGVDGHFAPSRPNVWDAYQDYGHSHWYDSFIVGDNVTGVAIEGTGTIDGGKGMKQRKPDTKGGGCRLIALRSCADVTLAGFSTVNGGWFTLLATDVDGLHISGTVVRAARDGFDLVGCRNVLVEGVSISGGGDDAMVLKSDFSVGRVLPVYNVTVRDSAFSCGCNALNFGSETVGDFDGILWENIVATGAGKAGIGIVTMDGANIRNVTYRNITLSNTVTPVHMYIGARQRAPVRKVGSISGIRLVDVVATHCAGGRGNWAATLDGQPADPGANVSVIHPIGPDITLTNVDLSNCSQGGHPSSDAMIEPPHSAANYPPRYLGTRPAYGMFVRNAHGVAAAGLKLGWEASARDDGRPAVVLENATVALSALVAQRSASAGIGYDVQLRAGTAGSSVTDSPGIIVKNNQ